MTFAQCGLFTNPASSFAGTEDFVVKWNGDSIPRPDCSTERLLSLFSLSEEFTDFFAIEQNCVSITLLISDFTEHSVGEDLQEWMDDQLL